MTLLTSPAIALILRITLLLGLALLAVRLLHRRGPAAQTVAGRAALAAVALLLLTAPLTQLVPPLWHVPAAPHSAAPVVSLTPSAPSFQGAGDLPQPLLQRGEGGASSAPTASAPALSPHPSFRKDGVKQGGRFLIFPSEGGAGGGLLLWAAGTALLLLWLVACQWQLTRLYRRAVPLTDGLAFDTLAALTPHPPCLLACPGINSPFLAGIVRPTIYLPADYVETFSPDALRAVLAHELAHADRHDTRWTLASRLLCALLWPQPLLWLLCRQLDHLAEDACDRAVLAHACPPRVYADCLLTLAERRPLARRQRALVQSIVPFRSQLAHRIQHILTIQGDHPMPAFTPRLRLAIAAATVFAALSGTLLISSAPAQTTKVPESSSITPPKSASSAKGAEPDARTVVGYGLRLVVSKMRYCVAIAGTPAAQAGVPTKGLSEILAVNDKPVPVSDKSFIALMHSVPPLTLRIKSPGKPARTYTLKNKAPYLTLTVAAEQKKRIEGLHQQITKSSEELKTRRQSLARYNALFQEEVQQALPGSDSQTLAKAINLERNIGWLNLRLKTIIEIGKQHPERKDTRKLVLATQGELKLLFAREARLFPATPETQRHLSRIHTLAVQCRMRETEVEVSKMLLAVLNQFAAKLH